MDELVAALKYFIYRDMLYILGGSAVLLGFLDIFGLAPGVKTPVPYCLLGAGFAYILGYAIQDGASLTPLVTTQLLRRPGRIVKWLYRRFERTAWEPVDSVDLGLAKSVVTCRAPDRMFAEWQRIIALKQVGTTVGPCSVVAGLLFVIAAFTPPTSRIGEPVELGLGAGALALGVLLVALGWLKTAQESQFVATSYVQLGGDDRPDEPTMSDPPSTASRDHQSQDS